jgi:starch synthase (maltosyl-transferring)
MHKAIMTPSPGDRLLRFVGDEIRFTLRSPVGFFPSGSRALLRTNHGKAAATRAEIISSYAGRHPMTVNFWRDVPMQQDPNGLWSIVLPLTEVGYFHSKAYLVDARGRQIWPDGPDFGLSVHPNCYRSANTIYCAFTRMFGETKFAKSTADENLQRQLRALDERGFTVIPPSGKIRDLVRQLPHITQTLGCRILHLLPVSPTPTTFARFGRFGSPYACQDMVAIDPALVEFDRRTTGVDQFRELTYATHCEGARVMLDVVINHTGWGSTLYENHPEWFLRDKEGRFASPGAWGVTWEDLVELEPRHTDLWEHFAEAFLIWCRRGVDGFRCDAGYKVPLPVWQYIGARVREEFPDTLFLLEGLGGSWEATETLLTRGGMQWAYSELFQNYSGAEVSAYLDYSIRQSERVGVYVHYSETHDNSRLAAKGRAWSLLRNRLCGLASSCGGFGFTCGVEWLAPEKIEVHQSRGMSWETSDNIVAELAKLNELLCSHPCFLDGAKLERVSPPGSPVYALRRDSADGRDRLLVLINTDVEAAQKFSIERTLFTELGSPAVDLLGQQPPDVQHNDDGQMVFTLAPAATFCLSAHATPLGMTGDDYRRSRAQAAFAVNALSKVLMPEQIGPFDWRKLAALVEAEPAALLAAVSHLDPESARTDLLKAIQDRTTRFPEVTTWTLLDRRRVLPVPPGHWLLLQDTQPFRARLRTAVTGPLEQVESVQTGAVHSAFFGPRKETGSTDAELEVERYAVTHPTVKTAVRFLAAAPSGNTTVADRHNAIVLLTNGTGAMARLPLDLGRVFSKYDCALAANLHSAFPVDRHVFAKRLRVWVNADGFITPLDAEDLRSFKAGPPAVWHFAADAGNERTVGIELTADMLGERNTTVFRFSRVQSSLPNDLPADREVRLTVRVDIEDRSFHMETHRNEGAEEHFKRHCEALSDRTGFAFTPANYRHLRVFADRGDYHPAPEWSENIPHPVEASRGQVAAGAAHSPGWFELPLREGEPVSLTLCADFSDPSADAIQTFATQRIRDNEAALQRAALADADLFGQRLALSARAFLVRRGKGKTVVAGYPWFLDWGRDTLICARGLLAAGWTEDVTDLLVTFGRFVENGTLPNTIHGQDASNRDTSDAPLWYGVVCEELAAQQGEDFFAAKVDDRRQVVDVLREIATGYWRGTPNGIRVDHDSGLVWSPSHFTWMDTNYPAGTPREGYPIEIQVLWIRLLKQLAHLNVAGDEVSWKDLAARAEKSLAELFWLEEGGYFADCILASAGQTPVQGVLDNALRSNFLYAISLGLITGDRARRSVEAARRYLVVPGALRSLAPLPVSPPLAIFGANNTLLNHPNEPYWGRYEGDEDTRRKPAYHNGTAWVFTFPTFCEALAAAWDFDAKAVAAAKAYLSSLDHLLSEGCIGQLPEILDGDAPHQQRGCDAQAWSVTEALRVWKLLNR